MDKIREAKTMKRSINHKRYSEYPEELSLLKGFKVVGVGCGDIEVTFEKCFSNLKDSLLRKLVLAMKNSFPLYSVLAGACKESIGEEIENSNKYKP